MSNNKNKNFISQRKNTNPYVKKGGKLKPSFWIVLMLMIFWTVGSVFGILATVKSCRGTSSSSMRTVSADGTSYLYGEIEYNSKRAYSAYSFSGTGCGNSDFTSCLNIVIDTFFDYLDNIYVISRTGDIPGDFRLRSSSEYSYNTRSFLKADESNYDLPQGYSLYYVSFDDTFYCHHFINQMLSSDNSSFDFDITFIFVRGYALNFSIPSLYEQGFLDSIKPVGELVDKDSLGIFQFGTFKCSLTDPSANENYNSWTYLPEQYIEGYYSGIKLSFYGDVLDGFIKHSGAVYGRYIVCDFGENGTDFDDYSFFRVIRISGKDTYSTGEYGVSVTFRFTDNSEVEFDTADDYFSKIDLSSYVGVKRLRSVVWRVSRSDLQFIGLTSYEFYDDIFDDGYSEGYLEGKSDGFDDGYDVGYNKGIIEGKVIGKNQALENGSYTFLDLMGAVVDAPIKAISGLLDFDLLGFNMLNFFFALCTCALIITVIRMFL